MDEIDKPTPTYEETGETQEQASKQILEHKLIPQPSDDPADPLNWPLTLKVRPFGTQTSSFFR